jgi:4-amino-4-deoxy-L-arabinose transferase-like glycosyltransferase
MQSVVKTFRQNKFSQPVISLFSPQKLSLIIICFGILIRVVQYLYNRSLWADEAVLALNIVNRSYLELLQPLDYDQGAPIGFLMVQKLAVQLLGDNEYALRLFPLLCGIASLFLFYKLANQCIQKQAVLIALTLFASLHDLVYYSFEVKQYQSDVAMALLSCLLVMHIGRQKLTFIKIIAFSLVGATAIWFSHPAIFVLAGVGITCLLINFDKREKFKTYQVLLIYFIWLVSFAVLYFVSLRELGGNEDLLTSWRKAFPSSAFDIIWFLDAFGKFFYKPLGFNGIFDGLAILAFVAGCVSLYNRKKETLFILLSPLLVTFFAAYLHKYPFRGRLVLFLTPFVILLIAEGAYNMIRKASSKRRAIAGVVLSLSLVVPPLYSARDFLIKPYWREEIKPIISYVKLHQQPEDVIYIFQRGEYQFKYYAEKYGYQPEDYIIGVDDLDKYDGKNLSEEERKRYKEDLDKLRGNNRVWLIFSHSFLNSENKMMKSYLDSIGKQMDFFESPGAFVYLYDLT